MSDPTNDPIEWVPTDRFVMPIIPEELHVNPGTLAILHCVSFLELSGDDTVDPDWAVEAMEYVAHYLQRISPDELVRLKTDIRAIVSWAESRQMPPHFIDLVKCFTVNIGLEPEE